jgi:hypothetical protein
MMEFPPQSHPGCRGAVLSWCKRQIYIRACQEHFSPSAGGAVLIRDIQPLVTTEGARLRSCPWVWVCVVPAWRFHVLVADDADQFQNEIKRCGGTVSTMDLSEARGLGLFRVIRGGIGMTQRLGATGTVSSTGVWHTHPRTRASQEPTGHHQKQSPEREGALHPRRSSGLRF